MHAWFGFVLLACLVGFTNQTLAATLVGHWTFDENGGATAEDSSGNDHYGTLVGSLTWTPGQFGSALHFEAVGTEPPPEYVRIGHDPALNFTTSFSISFWIKAGPQPLSSIIDKSHGGGDFTGWTIEATSGNNLLVAVGTGSGFPEATIPGVLDDTWHHVAVTVSLEPNLRIRGYRDGVLVTDYSNTATTIAPNDRDLLFGAWDGGLGGASPTLQFVGMLDEVLLYGGVLTTCEIVGVANPAGFDDCNSNGTPDACELVDCPQGEPSCSDCNGNNIPDGCEISTPTWTNVTNGPTPRVCSNMAYDTVRDRVVIFGGYIGGPHDGETWEWDGNMWTLRANSGPSPRGFHALAFDAARARVVLFGGVTGYASTGPPIYDGETWEWDGISWTRRATSGPSPRGYHAMAYDATRERVVLFGGMDGAINAGVPVYDGETWEWDGNEWTLRASNGPSPRTNHAMAYDAAHGRVVLFGGTDGPTSTGAPVFDGETWEWDGNNWTLRATAGPSPRASHAMAYDSTRSRLVLFGGADNSVRNAETWEWDGISWSPASTNGPSARSGHAMTFDTAHGRVVLFGGNDGAYDAETWEWNGDAWTLRAADGPSPRVDHAMAYDAPRDHIVLFGGSDGAFDGETWEWDGGSWTLRATTGPSSRRSHAMAYDATRARVVLFGGYRFLNRLEDTWDWDGITWTLLASSGPSPRESHEMIYDSARDRIVLFGGWNGVNRLGDTWEWDGTIWTLRAISGPSPRFGHAMTYDTNRGRAVLFGGIDAGGDNRETWEWDGSSWMLRATSGPSSRRDHAMAYDADRARVVLFGGLDFGGRDSETWEWDGTEWRLWATNGPNPRYNHAMAYDSTRGQIVLFGGNDGGIDGETWIYDGGGHSLDCNQNGLPDECDVANCPPNDSSCMDCNNNDVPDECEPTGLTPGSPHSGDMDASGHLNTRDVPLFVLTLVSSVYNCVADLNDDGFSSGLDIPLFVAAVLDE